MDCKRCNGAGHLAIVGDDDMVCPACDGAGEAVSEPLSAVAQIRLQLDKYHKAIEYRHILKSYYDAQEINAAKHELVSSAEDKFQALFDHIDTQATEIMRLQRELKTLTDANEKRIEREKQKRSAAFWDVSQS